MVNKNGACPQPPMRPEPKMPSIEPLVSVKSVNGQTGEVVLKDLIIGEGENAKRYNGSDQKRITAADLGLGNAFRYCGIVKTIEKAEEKMLDAKCGDVYFCKEDEKFYLSVGEGEYKLFSNGQGGGSTAWEQGEGLNSVQLQGENNHARGEASVAEGVNTTAEAIGTHAEGNQSIAIANFSHAEGNKTTAGGQASHAEGNNTTTNNQAEHAEGKFNYSHTGATEADNTIHSIGIGHATQDMSGRKNAVEVMENGDAYILGVGNYTGSNYANANTVQKVINDKQTKLVAGENITIEGNVISAKGGTKFAGMYIGSVVRDAGNPTPQKNLIGLYKDEDVIDLEELKTKGYSNYIADNFSCTCFAYPQSLGTLTSIQMNDVPFEMLPMFNRYDDYKAADGTKFYIYTFNQTVNPEYNKYVLKWN